MTITFVEKYHKIDRSFVIIKNTINKSLKIFQSTNKLTLFTVLTNIYKIQSNVNVRQWVLTF